ncbi:PDDEXK-like family protein [Thiomonas bhubaneswarensis]|uniref:PD-(D/E)XK nuclease superfamily n=1 Tax=Thiomonas bhubaneswarensis TaxID=339866 RepID=A0A0K6ICS4_9BURK|nr:PD-(D/E)XK nuclease family protein [Thiomonas bhubaneswarensis]CUB00920.1 PD-(D/E)XK nuclease superfamily [Thiomonas bhubaneswarensis]
MTPVTQKVESLLNVVSETAADYRGQSERKLANLLNQVHMNVSVVRQAKQRFAGELAPDFRIFDYLRTDESGLSRCLATLLNPQGSHGQQQVFLKAFLRRMPQKIRDEMSSESATVTLEHQTIDGRRIDILIDNSSGIIGIENKPWAADQDRQLTDYADHLSKVAGDRPWTLVFLSNREPSSSSLPKSRRKELEVLGQFMMMTYHELNDWLAECAGQSRALKVRVFIEELGKFISSDINGEVEMSEAEEIEKTVFATPEHVESAILIASSMDELKRRRLCQLERQLKSECEKRGLILDWRPEKMAGHCYDGFTIYCHKSARVGVSFEFQSVGFKDLIWGVYPDGQNTKEWPSSKDEIIKRMEAAFGRGENNKFWFWCIYAGENEQLGQEFKDWSANPKPWLAIWNGSLAVKIADLSAKVCELFKDRPELLVGTPD